MSRVYWLTGLSGAGKTTIGRVLYRELRKDYSNLVFLDGDELRQVFGNDLGYSKEDRYRCAMRYARICRLLSKQEIITICCTISMFDEVRKWNRENIRNYTEVYIKVPIEILKKRNQKGLYSGIEDGSSEDVVGMDLELELPKHPDIILENNGKLTPEEIASIILKR